MARVLIEGAHSVAALSGADGCERIRERFHKRGMAKFAMEAVLGRLEGTEMSLARLAKGYAAKGERGHHAQNVNRAMLAEPVSAGSGADRIRNGSNVPLTMSRSVTASGDISTMIFFLFFGRRFGDLAELFDVILILSTASQFFQFHQALPRNDAYFTLKASAS